MGKRAAIETVGETVTTSNGTNGDTSETRAPLTSAQRLAASAAPPEVAPDPFGMEAKYFTELRTLNRDVSKSCFKLSFYLHFFRYSLNSI